MPTEGFIEDFLGGNEGLYDSSKICCSNCYIATFVYAIGYIYALLNLNRK